jgi:glycosyltransferase involved in cell wall biosynthesis
MFGNGPLHSQVQNRAQDHSNVSVFDFSTNLAEVFAAIDLMVLTSDNEGVPLSVMEAAAAGIPVVSMRVGGVAEIVEHGVTGLLANDDEELRAAVVQLVRNADLRASMGSAARRTIHERCSLTNYLNIHDDLYTRLLVR